MKGLILAAGKGSRLRPLTENKPKVLVKVKGRPLIEHIIKDLRSLGIKDISIVKGYMGDVLEDRLKKYRGLEFIEQDQQLGTAHAIGLSSFESPFVAVNGDVFMHRKNIEASVSEFKKDGADVVVGSFRVENPSEFGVLETEGKNVKNLVEKPESPKSNLINTGVYVFSSEIYRYIEKTELSSRGEYEITDSIRLMLEDGKNIKHTEFEEYWIDVGRHSDLERAREIECVE